MVNTAQTSSLRTQQPAHSLTQDAPFQFLEQFIIRPRVCVSTHITCVLLQRGSGFEPGFLSSCGKNTVITLSASWIEHPSRKGLVSDATVFVFFCRFLLCLHQVSPDVAWLEMTSSGCAQYFDTADITKSDSVQEKCPGSFVSFPRHHVVRVERQRSGPGLHGVSTDR